MNLNLVNEITKSQMRNDLPELKAGMTIRVGKVRRAKLYYLRSRSGKSARIKEVR